MVSEKRAFVIICLSLINLPTFVLMHLDYFKEICVFGFYFFFVMDFINKFFVLSFTGLREFIQLEDNY